MFSLLRRMRAGTRIGMALAHQLDAMRKTITLAFTDEPVPPEPPYQAGELTRGKASSLWQALKGIGSKVARPFNPDPDIDDLFQVHPDGSVLVVTALDQGTTAFEGRFRDGKTKEVIAEFKDREYGQMDVVSLADFEWGRHSRHTVEVWGDDLEEVCYAPPGGSVSGMSTVTLRPW